MDGLIIDSIISVSTDVLIRSLPFIIFGIFVWTKFKNAAVLFILSASCQIAVRLASEVRRYSIREMHDSEIPVGEIAMTLQNQLPGFLGLLAVGLMISALYMLAKAINRSQ